MRAVADKIKENREELAKLETLDTGKTLEESMLIWMIFIMCLCILLV